MYVLGFWGLARLWRPPVGGLGSSKSGAHCVTRLRVQGVRLWRVEALGCTYWFLIRKKGYTLYYIYVC